MDDGEVEPSDHLLLGTCTHTHTCNPPGPDAAHTHTCYHTHTQVFSSGDEDQSFSGKKPRKVMGNREAVRKYREKKKAQAAYLEEEVMKLRLLNQELVRKIQEQAALEAEIMRLRGLLFGIKGKIDDDLGLLPFQKGISLTVNVGLPCENEALVPFDPSFELSLPGGCVGGGDSAAFDRAIVDCRASGMVSVVDCPISGLETFVSSTKEVQ